MKKLLALVLLSLSFSSLADTFCFRNDGHYLVNVHIATNELHSWHPKPPRSLYYEDLPILQERCIDYEADYEHVRIMVRGVMHKYPTICNYWNITSGSVRIMTKGDLLKYWCDVERI